MSLVLPQWLQYYSYSCTWFVAPLPIDNSPSIDFIVFTNLISSLFVWQLHNQDLHFLALYISLWVYWRIVSSSWRFIPPFTFGNCWYLWKSLLPLNNNYWLFLIYCAWCIVVYWCNSYTIVHFSLDIIEWFKYKLKKVLNCTWYLFTPFSISTDGNLSFSNMSRILT